MFKMKKIYNDILDFVLLSLLLVLAGVFSLNVYKRFDLTSQGAYSISNATKTTLKTLTNPLTVNLFFSDSLPSPYNETRQYVGDLMEEYNRVSNENFSYKFFNMSKEENEKIAEGYGLTKVQIHEAKTDEVGMKQVWMGIVISYGANIEVLNGIATEKGFEYKLTTKISKMVSTADALSRIGADEKINLNLYLSNDLLNLKIAGIDQVVQQVRSAFNELNQKKQGRLSFNVISPEKEDVPVVAAHYGINKIGWKMKDGTIENGVFGLVLEYGDSFKAIPVGIQSVPFFGSSVTGLESINPELNNAIESLFSKTTAIGFISGHGEMETSNPQNGQEFNYITNLSDMYSPKSMTITEQNIPNDMNTIVIAGAKSDFTDDELYKIDQFLMKGGNIMIFADSFTAQQTNPYYPPQFTPINTSLSKILDKYGVKLESNLVFDESCFKDRQRGPQYYAPAVMRKNLDSSNPIAKNLDSLFFVAAGGINVDGAKENGDLKVTVLAKTSDKAWTQSENIMLDSGIPGDYVARKAENLAVLIEGKFTSAFDKNPSEKDEKTEYTTSTHLAKATQSGKIFVVSTTQVLNNSMFDRNCSEPIAMFIRNAFDYMNGNADLCTMRTKSFDYIALDKPVKTAVRDQMPEAMKKQIRAENARYNKMVFLKYFCEFGLPALIVLAGIIVYILRRMHRTKIHLKYNSDDKRDSFNDKKQKKVK